MSGFITRGWQNSRVIAAKVSTVQTDTASSTALKAVTGLSHKLQGGKTYLFDGHITATATANGGSKLALFSFGGLTVSQFTMTGSNNNAGTVNALTTTTTLGNAVGGASAVLTDF